MKSLESLSKANFTIGTILIDDCKFINIMADERGLPEYDSNLFEISFKCVSFRFQCVVTHNLSQQLNNMADPENRMSTVVSPFNLGKFYKVLYKSGVSSVIMLDENVSPFYWGYQMSLALKDIIFLKASQLVESGILSNYLKKFSLEDFKTKLSETGPQVLTLQHLAAGFVIICGLLSLSVLAFIIECTPNVIRKLKKMFEICLICYIVVKFTKMNKML
jgi:hypothetical protein